MDHLEQGHAWESVGQAPKMLLTINTVQSLIVLTTKQWTAAAV